MAMANDLQGFPEGFFLPRCGTTWDENDSPLLEGIPWGATSDDSSSQQEDENGEGHLPGSESVSESVSASILPLGESTLNLSCIVDSDADTDPESLDFLKRCACKYSLHEDQYCKRIFVKRYKVRKGFPLLTLIFISHNRLHPRYD